jgi:hypothetical protein
MALKGRDKLLITLPENWDPDFIDNLDGRRLTIQWLVAKQAELNAYFPRPDQPDPMRQEKIQSLTFKLLIRRIYEWQVAECKPDVDLGGQTHLDTAIAALENSLRKVHEHQPRRRLRDVMAGSVTPIKPSGTSP